MLVSHRSRIVNDMNQRQQPRQPVGARRNNETVAGQFANKPVPDINNEQLGFNTDTAAVKPCGWDRRVARVGKIRTVFTRTVETDETGSAVVSVTADCDGPELLLLTKKGDPSYWNFGVWAKDHETRRAWTADITSVMLREGLVDTVNGTGCDGVQTAMTAAARQTRPPDAWPKGWNPHCLTAAVAQIRGLRMLQSMAPPGRYWETKLGGYNLGWLDDRRGLLRDRFEEVCDVYNMLHQPPWDTTHLPKTPAGPQPVAGHATTVDGDDFVFVGEHGDLLWRVLTETTHDGMSPLKEWLCRCDSSLTRMNVVVAAVLYDETAEYQLTHGLFDAVPYRDECLRTHALKTFAEALSPFPDGKCRWSPEQQDKIRGFMDVIEALDP